MGALTSKPYAFLSRPWELKNVESIDVFDTYHSALRFDYRGNEILRVLPALDNRVNEEWISDKARFFYDALQKQRISVPWLNAVIFLSSYSTSKLELPKILTRNLLPVSWSLILETFERLLFGTLAQGKSISALKLFGNVIDLKNLQILKQLFVNIGRTSYFKASSLNFGLNDFRENYLLDKTFLFSRAKRIFLIYFNPRFELPILNIKLRNMVNLNKVQIFGFTHNFSINYEVYNLGNRLSNLFQFLSGRAVTSKLIALRSNFESAFLAGGLNFVNSLTFSQSMTILKSFQKTLAYSKTFKYFFVHSQSSSMSTSEINVTSVLDVVSSSNYMYNPNVTNFIFNYCNDSFKFVSNLNSIHLYFGANGDLGALNSDLVFPISAITEENNYFLNVFGLVRKSGLVLYPSHSEIRTFTSVAKVLNEIASRVFVNFNRLNLTTSLIFDLQSESLNYTANAMKLSASLDGFESFSACAFSSNFSTFLPTSFLNDFFLTDSTTRSSQFLSLASKNYSEVTSNFMTY